MPFLLLRAAEGGCPRFDEKELFLEGRCSSSSPDDIVIPLLEEATASLLSPGISSLAPKLKLAFPSFLFTPAS